MHDVTGKLIEVKNYTVRPDGFTIPYTAEKIHGISTEKALKEGLDLKDVLDEFYIDVERATFLVGHNIDFDINIVGAEYYRLGIENGFMQKPRLDTKEESTDYCALPGGKGGKFKWPNLSELHWKLFNEGFGEAHNASADVVATARCFLELIRLGIYAPEKLKVTREESDRFMELNPDVIKPISIEIEPNRDHTTEQQIQDQIEQQQEATLSEKISFTHLHVHTQYSILDGAADVPGLISKAKKDGMKALAITDHGNMFGVKDFFNQAKKQEIKPILGCEVYVSHRSRLKKEDKRDGSGNHLVLLAKNYEGYKNLMKLVSFGWTDGFYYKPRIDKELLKQYHTGLIALSACLNGVIAEKVLHENNEAALKEIEEYKNMFGDDFYLELQRHPSGDEKIDKKVYQDQVYLNQQLIELAAQSGLKYVATNDVHFINKEDAAAHDRLLCLSTGKDLDDPNRMRYTQQEWFKTQQEMRELFADVPEALRTTDEIVNKVEEFELNSNPIMPDFPLPEGFDNEDDYLKHITYQGAHERYGDEIPAEIKERLDFELGTIQKMGFPGYFLIVWDFIRAAREMGVSVGPGRGSAAGSVVAYSLKITDIDPIKYDLLFERFLNPDRISMPDIDIDFDEDGREKVLEWVVNKYGKKRVAHIITFGTMAPKMAIRDVARVQKLELSEADRLAKLVPERPGTTFKKAYAEVQELKAERESTNPLVAQTLKYAEVLEGSVRQTGVHACGIIIGKNDLEEHIPICTNKDAELFVTQYDGKHVESVGMLKMDFLGLKTLSIIKDAVENIKLSRGEDVDISKVSLEDPATFELYSKGETTALFQFESPGMKKHLRALKPNRFEDLIAMNALYRPGPMEYIPSFIARKHGLEKIMYDLPEMEEYLEDTYGITVYQEQVMLLSQKLAGFTKGQADSLRKAMGKKIKSLMDELRVLFMDGCKKNGFEETVVNKIWKDWEAFAQYAFNKSHSTCYAYVSYQTAYLKAHYPAEFMSAVLSRNLNDIKKITFFMDECRRMGLSVLGPDVNESFSRFTVNKKGDIRFGMAAIKGVGGAAVDAIIKEREENGPYKDYYDFMERVNLTTVNKRCIENLITAGAFDGFEGTNRHQFFAADDNESSFLENLVKYGIKMQSENTSAPTLFGGIETIEISKPVPPVVDEWPMLMKLNKEKELIGIYLSSHPLDSYRFELENLNTTPITALQPLTDLKGREITIAGIVSQAAERFTKNGSPFGEMTLEDYTDSYRMVMFSKDYLRFKSFFARGYYLLIKGKVQQNPYRDELEFKVTDIKMLSEVKKEVFKKISIVMPVENVSEEFLTEIDQFTENPEGTVDLRFVLFDRKENISVELFSRNRKVSLSQDFIDYLKNNSDIEYKVN